MPSIRHPLHYPTEYFNVLERVALKHETVVVRCETPEAARKLRGHFYAFIGSLKRAANSIKPEFADEFAWAQRTMCSLEGSTLTFQTRDQSWQAKLMREALGRAAPGVPDVVVPPSIAAFAHAENDPDQEEEE
jgi:hypothetical protein